LNGLFEHEESFVIIIIKIYCRVPDKERFFIYNIYITLSVLTIDSDKAEYTYVMFWKRG